MKKALFFAALAFALVPAASKLAVEPASLAVVVADGGQAPDEPNGCTGRTCTSEPAKPNQPGNPEPALLVDGGG